MEYTVWLPIFIMFLIIFWEQGAAKRRFIAKKNKTLRRRETMANKILERWLGKECIISTGSFGTTITGTIVAVEENWIEVETKKDSQLINADFITNITPKPQKNKTY